MASFKTIKTKIFRNSNSEISLNTNNRKNHGIPVLIKEFGPIDFVDFSPIEPYHFAITCSCRIQIYNPITKLVSKNLNKFKKNAYGGYFRRDGRLLCAGGEEAVVKLFDVNTKSLLRIFTGHKAPVHRTFFTSDGMHIISFSDDKTTTIWDIPSEKKLNGFEDHTDYVRAGNVSPVSPDIFISGGYDKEINMYDRRINKKILNVNHGAPVESILFLPSGGIFLSAGGNEIRIWDCLKTGRLLAKICQHSKTVTCLQIACNGQQILSGSLDKHIRIYNSGTYKTIRSLNYPNSVLSAGISADSETIVAGMIDGMVSIQQKEKGITKMNHKTISYRYRSENLFPPHIETYVHQVNKDVMGKHDICLRKFQYSKALDYVMMNYIVNKSPHVTVTLFQELNRRQGLIQALAGRDGKSLINILKFIIRYIGSIKFGKILSHVTNILIDIYEDKLEELNMELHTFFKNLTRKLKEEYELILSLLELQGVFEMILSTAETTVTTIKNSYRFLPSITAQKDLVLNIN